MTEAPTTDEGTAGASTEPSATEPASATKPVDGRRLRRERGRRAVVDAMVDLIQEGRIEPPSAQEVAARAGVSVSSLFRYFENLTELRNESILHFLSRFADLFEVPDLGVGGFDERIDGFVRSRLRQYETVAPTARFARARALEAPELAENLERVRRRQADQVRAHFAPELARLDASAADDAVVAVAALTSFEAWDLARTTLGRSSDQLTRAWRAALVRLLST